MTSKNLFFKLMREDLKRRIWAVGLAFLTFFFSMPVAAAMGASNIAKDYERWVASGTTFKFGGTPEVRRYNELLQLAEEILSLQNYLVAFLIGAAAVILALTGYMFLHSKKQVDFYNSVPVKREILFFVKYLDGVLIIVVTYLVNMLFAFGILAGNGVPIQAFSGGAVLAMLIHMVGFLLIYGTMILAVLLTGNFFISILGGITLFSYLPAAAALMEGLIYLFFTTSSGQSSSLLEDIMIHGSPIGYYGSLVSKGAMRDMIDYGTYQMERLAYTLGRGGNGYGELMKEAGMAFLAALALMMAGMILYRLRPSESAGKAMAFSRTKAPIKFLLVVPVTIGMGVLFWNIYFSLGWAAFGFLFGLLITHCVIEIIYHFEFRKLFAHPLHMAACAVLALGVIGIYRYDLFGYDRYIPKEKEFQSASISAGSLNDWYDYGYPFQYSDGGSGWIYMSQADYVSGNMRVTDYELVRAIAESGIEEAKLEKEAKLTDQWDRERAEGYWTRIEMGYHLKNGKQVFRTYTVNVTENREIFDRLYASEEYKSGTYPVLSYAMDNIVGIYEAKAEKISKLDADRGLQEKILDAYKEELSSLTLAERVSTVPVTSLRFLTIAEYDYIKQISSQRHPDYTGDFMIEDMAEVNMVPVYPSFTKTIALLKEAGSGTLDAIPYEDVDRIEIYNRYFSEQDYEEDYGRYGNGGESVRIQEIGFDKDSGYQRIEFENDGSMENEERIRAILASSVPTDLAELNELHNTESGIEVRIFRKSQNEGKKTFNEIFESYDFDAEKIPDFVEAELIFPEGSRTQPANGLE